MITLDVAEFSLVSEVNLIVPRRDLLRFREYRISLFNVLSNLGAGAVLTMICSTDRGVTFDENPVYTDTGFSQWSPEGLGGSYSRVNTSFGLTVAPDSGDVPELGANGDIWFKTPGFVAGNPVHSTYTVPLLTKGELGGSDGHKQVQIFLSGSYNGAIGQRVNAWKFQANRGGAPDALISGLITLQGVQ